MLLDEFYYVACIDKHGSCIIAWMDAHEPVLEILVHVNDYILFFNEQRPAYSLNYLTPKQYRESNSAVPIA